MDDSRLSKVLVDFARALTPELSPREILDHLVDRIVEIVPGTRAGALVIHHGAGEHTVAASDEVILALEELQLELGEGPGLLTARTGEALGVHDLRSGGWFPEVSARAADAGVFSVFCFPLRLGAGHAGAIELWAEDPMELTADDLDGCQLLADVSAAHLSHAWRHHPPSSPQPPAERTHYDRLTGLPNGFLLQDRLHIAMDAARRTQTLTVLLFLTIGDLATTQATGGQARSDALVVELVGRVRALLRPGDTLARLSANEFVVLCAGLTRRRQADLVAERILAHTRRPFMIGESPAAADVTMRVAFADGEHKTPALALTNAAPARQVVRADTIGCDLALGLDNDALHLRYQPIVDVTTGRWTAVEALLRWDHPRFGELSPQEVLTAAEDAGLTVRLAGWILLRACRDMRRWHARGDLSAPPCLAVNVSFRELLHPGYVAMVARVLTDTGLPPTLLCLEITEDILLEDQAGAARTIAALRELGLALALDDFGTGYSSLAHLKDFPVATVKIDQSFVADSDNAVDDAIVAAVVSLSHALDLSVIAEGVETEAQLSRMRAAGCDSFQGFLCSVPLTCVDLEDLMRRPVAV